ncbi:MAG: hypothetical protein V7605_956 [Acidimicrobiaceae bacterium]|jgi:hypothetical protein
MRKIIATLAVSAFASGVLAFAAPMAANAATPARDAFCLSTANTFNTLIGQINTARTNLNTAVNTTNARRDVLSNATATAATAAAALIAAQDTIGGDVAGAQADLNAAVSAFSTAATNWLNAHIVAVNDRNLVTGAVFTANYVQQSSADVGCSPSLNSELIGAQPVEVA